MTEKGGEKSLAAEKADDASARFARAVIDLRRNPRNRALQRYVYLVGEYELTPVQVDILEAVIANPGQKMTELAQVLGVNASTASRTTLPLVELGLIERRNEKKDRRVVTMSPTPSGLKQAKKINESRNVLMKNVLIHFTEDELIHFADLMEKYISFINIEGEKIEN
ncbi:MarR family winged helix-turn-helix transcriptional regulator [Croceicoccus estronivorus]|uniref:MarR family winged helix-turn-helix transcriptional regulator n=1 Tax=Croceicoccus estronivorus TaxID=1172626 RepID=UPI000AF7E08E|nr:MarR family winged helix-turn-helix transcriptional regulator [Croceicoccus estronivorus]